MRLKGNQMLRPTLNSERSPSVHYANWKETMLLKKQLSTLHRTEHGLLHRITVDQKVMFRRFQVKLQRSKIAHARLRGCRVLEKELRSSGMRRLHSESHLVHGADDEFLSKLERRPYSVDKEEKDQAVQKTQKSANAQLQDDGVTEDDLANLVRSVMNEQPISNTRHNLRSLSALGHMLQASFTSTAPGLGSPNRIKSASDAMAFNCKSDALDFPEQTIDKEREFQPNSQIIALNSKIIDGSHASSEEELENKTVTEKSEPEKPVPLLKKRMQNKNISVSTIIARQPILKSQSLSLKQNTKEQATQNDDITSSSFSSLSSSSGARDPFRNQSCKQNEVQIEIPKTSRPKVQVKPRQRSPSLSHEIRPINLPDEETNHHPTGQSLRKKKSSIFEESAKPDFRGQRLAMARAVDHSDLVRSFCDGLAVFGQGVPNFDYYASKMQADAKTQVKTALLNSPPGTPETDYRKYTGDQTIKCITLPRLKLRRPDDADDSDNEYDHSTHFESLVLSPADRSLDADAEGVQSYKD